MKKSKPAGTDDHTDYIQDNEHLKPWSEKEFQWAVDNRKTDNVCIDCGVLFLSEKQKQSEGNAITCWKGQCCLCMEIKTVTDIRHYNYLRKPEEDHQHGDNCSF